MPFPFCQTCGRDSTKEQEYLLISGSYIPQVDVLKRFNMCPCWTAHYCGVDCQLVHWKEHKKVCIWRALWKTDKSHTKEEASVACRDDARVPPLILSCSENEGSDRELVDSRKSTVEQAFLRTLKGDLDDA